MPYSPYTWVSGEPITRDKLNRIEQALATASTPFLYGQPTPAATWTINHGLGRYPAAVSIILTSGEVVEADVVHSSINQTVVSFPAPTTGQVELI